MPLNPSAGFVCALRKPRRFRLEQEALKVSNGKEQAPRIFIFPSLALSLSAAVCGLCSEEGAPSIPDAPLVDPVTGEPSGWYGGGVQRPITGPVSARAKRMAIRSVSAAV
jgi:hypothetical protein